MTILLLLLSLPAHATEKESAYNRVMRTGVLKCGYFTWPPYFIKDPNTGSFSGVFHDYTEALAKNLGLKVEWVGEMNFGTFLEDINNGRYDLECTGGWPNAQRGKLAFYTQPIYYIAIVPFVRADDVRFKTMKSINSKDVRVAVIDGENGQFIRKNRFPDTQETALPQTATGTDALMNVMTGKADIAFTDLYSGLEFSAANKGSLKPLFKDRPLQMFQQNMTLPRGDTELKNMLDIATEELTSTGQMDEILDKYEKHKGSFYRLAKPYEVPK